MKQVYVHGLGQIPASWEHVISKRMGTEQRLCPHLAKLVQGKEVTYQNLYRAFSEVCDGIDGSIRLCGLSLGAVLALNYTVEHPGKVNALVLIAPQYKMPKGLLKFQNFLFRFIPKSAFQQMGFQKADFLLLCKTMMELDFSDQLSRIQCPVMVICGEKDRANKKAAEKLANLLLNAEFQVIPGAGHEVNVEEPVRLAEMLEEFCTRR